MPGKPSYEILKQQVKDLKAKLKSSISFETHEKEIKSLKSKLSDEEIAKNSARSVLEVNPNPIVIYDMDGKVEYLNKCLV
ncbi:MAG: hypothetical protein L3J69_11555 [Desulfobacula sp.]|nr:hypothetical protein [Desulfobacula sp.]